MLSANIRLAGVDGVQTGWLANRIVANVEALPATT